MKGDRNWGGKELPFKDPDGNKVLGLIELDILFQVNKLKEGYSFPGYENI